MSGSPKIDRARRNALKAGSLVLGAVLAAGALQKAAWAAPDKNKPDKPGKPDKPDKPGKGDNCFARGTEILTREGYRPIEALTVGDEVAVRFQGFASIKTMPSHTLNGVSGKWDGNPHNLPVLIRRGALGEKLPSTDLCVTALHAVYVDGYLMNAGDLVNGTSIVMVAAGGRDTLDFFNIELDRHDILDAQGASFESLYRAGTERCASHLGFDGGRSKLRSRLRSVASLVIDRRQPIDIIRDKLEERGLDFARAA